MTEMLSGPSSTAFTELSSGRRLMSQLDPRRAWRLGGIAFLLVVGCSSGGTSPPALPEPVPFEGIVKLDGQPLESATVVFHPRTKEGFHGAMGVTDASGKYVLNTDLGNGKTKPGALSGSYDVTVSRLVGTDGAILKPDPNTPPMMRGGKQSIPIRYSTVNERGLTCEVPAAGGKYDIEMVSSN